jgi:Ni/Co efflux regulator RcnB
MKSIRPLITHLSVALLLASSGLQAAPQDSQGRGHDQSRSQPHHQSQQQSQHHGQPARHQQGGHDRLSNRGQATQAREPVWRDSQHAGPAYSPPRSSKPHHDQYSPRYQQPPRHFRQVHQSFHQHIRIVEGRRLPRGYGHRLDAHALRGLPHYHGYEWRRTGSDIVLIAVTSGIVYAILRGVLE